MPQNGQLKVGDLIPDDADEPEAQQATAGLKVGDAIPADATVAPAPGAKAAPGTPQLTPEQRVAQQAGVSPRGLMPDSPSSLPGAMAFPYVTGGPGMAQRRLAMAQPGVTPQQRAASPLNQAVVKGLTYAPVAAGAAVPPLELAAGGMATLPAIYHAGRALLGGYALGELGGEAGRLGTRYTGIPGLETAGRVTGNILGAGWAMDRPTPATATEKQPLTPAQKTASKAQQIYSDVMGGVREPPERLPTVGLSQEQAAELQARIDAARAEQSRLAAETAAKKESAAAAKQARTEARSPTKLLTVEAPWTPQAGLGTGAPEMGRLPTSEPPPAGSAPLGPQQTPIIPPAGPGPVGMGTRPEDIARLPPAEVPAVGSAYAGPREIPPAPLPMISGTATTAPGGEMPAVPPVGTVPEAAMPRFVPAATPAPAAPRPGALGGTPTTPGPGPVVPQDYASLPTVQPGAGPTTTAGGNLPIPQAPAEGVGAGGAASARAGRAPAQAGSRIQAAGSTPTPYKVTLQSADRANLLEGIKDPRTPTQTRIEYINELDRNSGGLTPQQYQEFQNLKRYMVEPGRTVLPHRGYTPTGEAERLPVIVPADVGYGGVRPGSFVSFGAQPAEAPGTRMEGEIPGIPQQPAPAPQPTAQAGATPTTQGRKVSTPRGKVDLSGFTPEEIEAGHNMIRGAHRMAQEMGRGGRTFSVAGEPGSQVTELTETGRAGYWTGQKSAAPTIGNQFPFYQRTAQTPGTIANAMASGPGTKAYDKLLYEAATDARTQAAAAQTVAPDREELTNLAQEFINRSPGLSAILSDLGAGNTDTALENLDQYAGELDNAKESHDFKQAIEDARDESAREPGDEPPEAGTAEAGAGPAGTTGAETRAERSETPGPTEAAQLTIPGAQPQPEDIAYQREQLERQLGAPLGSIERTPGGIERSPLFRGTPAVPQQEMFPPRIETPPKKPKK